MGDQVFRFGKHRGRRFSEVARSDTSYVRWAKNQGTEASGQLKDFLDFCAASGRAVSSAPGANSVPKIALTAELYSGKDFRLVADRRVPSEVASELTDLAQSTSENEWCWPLSSHEDVIKDLMSKENLRTVLDIYPLPWWLVMAMRNPWVQDVEMSKENDLIQDRPQIMEFQKEGIHFGLSHSGRILLADEMGLGKTLQALVIMDHFRSDWPLLVVAPSALRMVWRDQALQWLSIREDEVQVILQGKQKPKADAKLVITSYEILAKNLHVQLSADGSPYKAIIVDESHYIKDPKSKRTGAVLKLCKAATRCVLISGTPAVNNAKELYTQLQALLPMMTSAQGYFTRYCEEEKCVFGGRSVTKWRGAIRKHELNILLTHTVMIRRLKKDVLTQLPSKRRQRVTLDTAKLDSAKMKQIASFMKDNVVAESELAEAPRPEITAIFKATAEAKMEAVGDYVEYLLENEIKFLLFAHHHILLDALEEKLKSLETQFIRIDGKTPQQRRPELVEKFQTQDVQVALLSITACGQGLTLTAAHTVVFAELYWVPGQMIQAEDRVHRIGQEEMVDVHYCIAQGSLDELIFGTLNKKSKDTTGILDGHEQQLAAPRTPAPSPSTPRTGTPTSTPKAKRRKSSVLET